jgi:tryptophan 2,3-dioxygenase
MQEVDVADYGEAGGTARSEQSELKTYAELLELPTLLSLQQTNSEPPVHDEMLFLIVHQTHELWFKQMVFELRALILHIDAAAWQLAERTTTRLTKIVGLLIGHIDVLETMPPEEFQRFRGVLGSASGMQSEQFKLIEELSGRLSPEYMAAPTQTAPASVREAFLKVLGGVLTPSDGRSSAANEGAASALFRRPAASSERRIGERLLHFDAEMGRWRARHMELARAMIGGAEGTGGSAGARYLEAALRKRFFPELWAARASAT